jgi:hypothetical protein
MSAENYIPLSEVDTKRVKTTLSLPYHIEEEIGLDIKRTELLCQLGGIASITIRNDESRTTPVIVGITKDGNALAGFSATDSLAKFQNPNISKNLPYSISWSRLDVSINIDEIRTKLDKQKKDVKNPDNWSKVINNSLKDSIASASFQNLIKRRATDLGLSILINAPLTTGIIAYGYMTKDILAIFPLFLGLQIGEKISSISKYGFEKSGEGKRLSLSIMEFPELDRKFVLDGIMLFSKLTKKIEK